MAEPIGLVLSGGGAKGAYEIGVYKALVHYNIAERITAFSGTSVGALNAVLIDSLGTAAEKVWLDLKLSDMMTIDVGRITRSFTSLFGDSSNPSAPPPTIRLSNLPAVAKYLYPDTDSLYANGLPFTQDRLSAIIDKNVNFKEFRHKIYVHSVRLDTETPALETFRLGSVLYDDQQRKEIVLASAALPGVYCGTEGVKIKGLDGSFIDGGYPGAGDNTPISTLYNKGFRRIIAVHLREDADVRNQSKFADAQIVNIIPSASMGGFITGTLNLTPDKIRRDLNLGYNDTLARLAAIRELTA